MVLAIVPDEESEEEIDRGTEFLIQNGFSGDFAITGEPTDLHVGVQAKGVLAMRLEISGTAAHGATPWLGDNAILKALDAFRRDRVAALHPRELRPVRPPVDQPRAASSAATRSTRSPTAA